MRIARLVREVGRGRWVSGALAVALVLAQGASLGHFALVRHAVCPLHGELIHPDSGPHAAPAARSGDPAKPALFGVGEDADSFRDDHCGVVGHRRDVALPALTAAAVLDDRPVAAAQPPVAAFSTSESRHRIAPKQSPPA